MLALTENAVTVIRELTEQPEVPDGAGLRIASEPVASDADAQALSLAITPRPEAGDQVLDAGGARLFVADDAADFLADKALDAEVDDRGQVSFQVALQPA
jgi:iron-sulfur cluster assembly protein